MRKIKKPKTSVEKTVTLKKNYTFYVDGREYVIQAENGSEARKELNKLLKK